MYCQDKCVVECCQSGAFSINVVSIGRWLDSERVDRSEELIDEISQIFSRLSGEEGVVCFKIRDLESLWNRKEATNFFEEMSEVFREASAARLNDSAS
ncbi:MAG: hypothetical protein CMO55_10225 [Verrucomicrobiales bacterium]|nr:hypothetical protein [Verrucomicrobiales bacterium]